MKTEAQDHPTRIYKIQNITKMYPTLELQVIFYIYTLFFGNCSQEFIIDFCLLVCYVTMREEFVFAS